MRIGAEVLEAFYGARVIGRYAIAKHLSDTLGISERFALKKLRTIEKIKDLKFTIEYPLRAFRLKRVAVFVTNEEKIKKFIEEVRTSEAYPFIRSVLLLIPVGAAAIYNVPEEVDVRNLSLPKDSYIIEYNDVLRNMTNLRLYGEDSIFDVGVATSKRNLSLLLQKIEESLNDQELINETERYVEMLLKLKHRFDWADLAIIKELEKNPLLSIEDIVSTLKISFHKVRKHLNKHIVPVLRGLRLKRTPVSKKLGVYLFLTGKSYSVEVLYAVCRQLVRHPLVLGAGINLHSREFILQIVVSTQIARDIIDYFRSLLYELDFEFINAFMGVVTAAFTLPYAKFKEYVPKVKWIWRRRGEVKENIKEADERGNLS